MTLPVLIFARLRDAAGTDTLLVDLPAGATVEDLRKLLAEDFPVLAPLLVTCRVAVNHEFAEDDAVIPAGAEVALIPPVSGG